MMARDAQVPAIDRTILTSMVRKALRSDALEIADWCAQLLHNELGGGGSVYLISGTACDHEEQVEWSVVLKIVSAPPRCDDERGGESGHHISDSNYWKREPLFYQSRLLGERAGGLVAPQCFGVIEPSEDTAWI